MIFDDGDDYGTVKTLAVFVFACVALNAILSEQIGELILLVLGAFIAGFLIFCRKD